MFCSSCKIVSGEADSSGVESPILQIGDIPALEGGWKSRCSVSEVGAFAPLVCVGFWVCVIALSTRW